MMPNRIDYDDWDEVIVHRIITGAPVGGPIATPDAARAVKVLAKRGYTDGQIAYRVHRTRRTVKRIRDHFDVPPALPKGEFRTHKVSCPTRPKVAG